MRVIVAAESDFEEDKINVTLTDESLDNGNFVELIIGDQELTLPVEELFLAAALFDERRRRWIAANDR